MLTFDLWAGVNPDLVDTLPFDPYLASAALPSSPPPVSPPKEADTLLTLPTLVLGETVDDDLDGSAIADPKDTKVESLPPVADPQASVPEVPGQPDVAAEPAATLDGTPKTDGFNALDHQDKVVCLIWPTVLYLPRVH